MATSRPAARHTAVPATKASSTKAGTARSRTANSSKAAKSTRSSTKASRVTAPKWSSAAPSLATDDRAVRAPLIAERLACAQPQPVCELDHRNPFELLVATILSAQSTDKMVNKVTPALFARWPTPAALAAATQEEVEEAVRQTGFFRNKAKAIRGTAQALVERHGGTVPADLESLVQLPGVARKTANVVLGTAFGIASGVTVDTHAGRVARRLGLTNHEDPGKVETDLMGLFERDQWVDTGHRLVLHGRYVCLARKPDCAQCPLNELCPAQATAPLGPWPERAEREQRRVESRGLAES